MLRELKESVLDKIEKNDSRLIPVDAEDSLQNVDYPDYMFILENTAVGDSPLKEGVSPELLEHTLAAFDVRYMIWYLDRFEYERIEEIDHSLDWKFNQKDYMTCIMFDYPPTLREQVKFIIQMMSVYWMSYWGYSDVLMYKFDGEKYVALEDRTFELVAAANDIAGFAFYLTHSDAKRSFQYEGEELKKLKRKICAMLPHNNSYDYQQVSKIIDQMLRIRKRRLKKYRHCGDSNGNNVKWRPIVTESVLDDIGEISADSAKHLAATQTENPLNYQFLYLIGIRTAELDVQNISTICEMFGLESMLIIYNRHELWKQEYVDWVKMSHLPDDEYFLFLFIDKLPDTLAHRIQFMLKLFTIVLQELDEDSTQIFRFDKVDNIFKMEKGGRIIKTWYKGYFGQYAENRKSYDDKFFTSQFATLVNTTDHSIYNECDAELRRIRDRILAKKSATRLDESVLDDIDGSDMKLDDVVQATAMPDELCYDYMFMFDIKNAPYNPEKIYDMSAAMGIDVRVNKYAIVEDDFASIDYIDHYMDFAHKTRNILAIFVNLPASNYRKALFIIQLLRRVWNIYDAEPNVWTYKRIRNVFKYVCQTVNTLSYIQATFKWNTIPASRIIENLRSDIVFIIRKINNDGVSHRIKVQKALMHILSASVFRTDNYKKSTKLQESVLDDNTRI